MKDDSIPWRPAPPSPYRATGRRTVASTRALRLTGELLRAVGPLEAACLWLGRFDPHGDAVVEGLVVPKQANRPRNYSISANAMQEVAAVARPNKWTLVASVHSHPGSSVEHSEYDDRMAPSRSALSLVFSHYGHQEGPWPIGIGVHEYIDNYWHLLPAPAAESRISFADGIGIELLDLR